MKKHQLVWDENRHSIGIASLDSQHREIVKQVNRVTEAIGNKSKSEITQELMDNLILLARQHFELEEHIMTEYGFPGLEGHAKEHRGLLQRLENLSIVLRTPNPHKMELVLAFVTDWAELHLLQGEKILGKYLTSKGLT